jgi:hypothetical protein
VIRCAQIKKKEPTYAESLIQDQILAITCDNATSNDIMIDKLAGQLVEFPGSANRACCFTHILNLVVKSIMHQFDVPKKWRKWNTQTSDGTRELLDMASDMDEEELETVAEQEDFQGESEEGPIHDNNDGWVDEQGILIQVEIDELMESVWPVTVVLTKVSE